MAVHSSRVLIVDGNELSRRQLERRLRQKGLRISAVGLGARGRKAIGAAIMLDPAVVLVNMTEMDLGAIGTIAVMSYLSPQTPIIALCSNHDALHLSVSAEFGVTCYVRREIEIDQLVRIIASLADWGVSGNSMTSRSRDNSDRRSQFDAEGQGKNIFASRIINKQTQSHRTQVTDPNQPSR